jgi:hypothetical protein
MNAKLLTNAQEKSFAIVMETGDEAMASLLSFDRENRLASAHFTGIGACGERPVDHAEISNLRNTLVFLGSHFLDRREHRGHGVVDPYVALGHQYL